MPRAMSTAMLEALALSVIYPAIFVEATFVSGTVYLWSGVGPIIWNGQTWTGIGSLGSISTIDEGATVEAKGMVLTLSGIDPTLLPDVLTEFQLGAPVTVYLGLFNEGALIANPVASFSGRMDQPTIEVTGLEAKIGINCESRLIDMNTAVDRRYTPEDQQRDWPGDLGLNFVNAIQEMTLYWGTSPTSTNNI
jgi:hypothetical protein